MGAVAEAGGIENVLLIVVDQWRGDHLKGAGHPALDLPNIEALAAEGVSFARHYAQCLPCAPSRTTLLTGLYLMKHRVVRNGTPLTRDFTNVGKEARRARYDPALVGYTTTTPDPRFTDANDPLMFVTGDVMDGWREITSFESRKGPYWGHLRRNGFTFPAAGGEALWQPRDGPPGPSAAASQIPAALSDTAWLTERSLDYLHDRLGRKWFLHLGMYRPHPPFTAPAPYHEAYAAAAMPAAARAVSKGVEAAQHPLLAYYLDSVETGDFFMGAAGLAADLTDADIALARAAYCGLLKEVDDHLGRVFAFLKESGQWDKTLIVFTSDHGEQLGDHHLFGKVGYFDAAYHVPMIVRDPRAVADGTRGRTVTAFTEHVDVMPTILEWIGMAVPRQCDGRSLLAWCHGEDPADWRRHVHYECDFRDVATGRPQQALGLDMDDCSLAVIQDADGKYVHFSGLPPLFFDLAADPDQFVDRAADPAHRERMLGYAQEMLSWRQRHADQRFTGRLATARGLIGD